MHDASELLPGGSTLALYGTPVKYARADAILSMELSHSNTDAKLDA